MTRLRGPTSHCKSPTRGDCACAARPSALSCHPVTTFPRDGTGDVSRRRPGVPTALLLALATACGGYGYHPTPQTTVDPGWTQTGMASWYGPGFDGRPTASGEIFDMDAMTAAHRTLPLGTRIEITVLATGRRTEVRVNDRGPFVDDRMLDVSRAAARRLGFLQDGTARVRIRVVEAPSDCFEVQVGSFAEAGNARDLRVRLRERGEPARVEEGPDGFLRVVAGPYASDDRARTVQDRHGGSVRSCRREEG